MPQIPTFCFISKEHVIVIILFSIFYCSVTDEHLKNNLAINGNIFLSSIKKINPFYSSATYIVTKNKNQIIILTQNNFF